MSKILGKNLNYNEYNSVDAGYTTYAVYGEDPNCDMGGSHICPFLGNIEGTFQDVLEYAANNMHGFYQWGGGGYIVPMKNLKENSIPIILDNKKKLQLERRAKLKKLVYSDVQYLIDNVYTLDRESLKEYLIEIKNKLE